MKSAIHFLARSACALTLALILFPSAPTTASATDLIHTYAPYAQDQNKWDLNSEDNFIGYSPAQIWRKWGRPDWTRTTRAGNLPVKLPVERLDLYKGNRTTIRVYGYSLVHTKKEIFFALEEGKWRVIGDVDYPKSLRW
ncbi:MAG TPA: hypothetical protein VK970_10810 [Candidatus Methylacidiphilales bacterium]|nr:hypothetical protein [Candidatus Methylacidiphilales bacterium]